MVYGCEHKRRILKLKMRRNALLLVTLIGVLIGVTNSIDDVSFHQQNLDVDSQLRNEEPGQSLGRYKRTSDGAEIVSKRKRRSPQSAVDQGSNLAPAATTLSPNIQSCLRFCPVTSEFNPVCGTDGVSYSNPGRLECAQQCGVDVQIARRTLCTVMPTSTTLSSFTGERATQFPPSLQNCIAACATSAEYKPVCGTNGVTYNNPTQLICAQICGVDVRPRVASVCQVTENLPLPVQFCIKSCPIMSEARPVCGTNGVTYANPSSLQCARTCGVKVEIRQRQPCPTSVPSQVPSNPSTNPPIPSTTKFPTVDQCVASCPKSSINNPICGTNGVTYNNPDQLLCTQLCGVDVKVQSQSACPGPNATDSPLVLPVTSSNGFTNNPNPQQPVVPNTEATVSLDVLNNIFTIPTTKDPTEDIDERLGDKDES